MNPAEAAGQALFRIEHPCTDPSTWEALDQVTRDWWVDRAGPITQAIQETTT